MFDRPGISTPEKIAALLDNLCMTLGFCLPPDVYSQLTAAPPTNVDDFTAAVFVAEGLDPVTAERHLYREVRALVADAFNEP